MKAISLRPPWWWFILYAGKDIENRDWPTRFRGVVWLHASRFWQHAEIAEDWVAGCDMWHREAWSNVEPDWTRMKEAGGCIVGSVEIVDVVTRSDSPWFAGEYGFVLRNPQMLVTPVPCRGSLGLFDLPGDVAGKLIARA